MQQPMQRPVVQAHHVSKHFGATAALNGVDLEVFEGELFGLVGPDGAGKSTLLRILAGAIHGEGQVALWDQPIHHSHAHLLEQVGYVSQRFNLHTDLTVAENLRFIGRLYGMTNAQVKAASSPLLEWSGLAPFANRWAGQLSGGMKQKLSLIAALLHDSKLLLLDEPTTAVDPVARLEFWQMLRELVAKGVTVVVSTVYLDEAAQCHRVAMMHMGSVLAQGSPSELRTAFPYQVYEVVTAPSDQTEHASRVETAAALSALPGVVRVVPYGARWRVQADPQSGPTTMTTWLDALAAIGITAQIRPGKASMEDVFVHLLENGGTGAA